MNMLHLIDSTIECLPMAPTALRPPNISVIAVHRISLSQGDANFTDTIPDNMLTGPELTQRFVENGNLGTGKRPPYHVLIRTDGKAEQMIPLSLGGQHVTGYNWCSWAVAVVGRYHELELPDRMWKGLIETLSVLDVMTRQIRGHSELDKSKTPPCPGQHINMGYLRKEVCKKMPPGCEAWDIRRRLGYIARAGFNV